MAVSDRPSGSAGPRVSFVPRPSAGRAVRTLRGVPSMPVPRDRACERRRGGRGQLEEGRVWRARAACLGIATPVRASRSRSESHRVLLAASPGRRPTGMPGSCRGTARSRAASTGSSATSAESGCAADAARAALVRYEDFIRSPRTRIGELAALIGRDGRNAPFVDDHTVELPANHTFAGNPSRFRRGRVLLASDDEWVHEQRRSDRLICELVTLPLMHRYGYALRTNSHAPA